MNCLLKRELAWLFSQTPRPRFTSHQRGLQTMSLNPRTPKSLANPQHLHGVSNATKPYSRLLDTCPKPKRFFHSTATAAHGNITRPRPGTGIKVNFKDSKGNLIKTVEANEGDDILSIAHEHDIDLEGACEGSVACSTCHVILTPEHYDLLPEPEDDENDMLDMAFGLTDTSRLGCQVKLTKELDGITATLPSATRNMFVDGKKPTHH
ncbi:2Fe-2S ferredoxin-type domain-containing protein [Lentinula detonsa]|uniref:2Fe-2S ferredoxin-type domain-containing protein n=1 Tax=Lentinula detonsa TaxID=2804962 RepID=A0AA38UUR9_9AGAR|nr:2Fe-2S ferredoxin-type domain-containing protein [Lentinula detonsa]